MKTSLRRDEHITSLKKKERPCWSCQWRVAGILLAVLVQFCSCVQANAGFWTSPQQLRCLGATLKDLENYMCSQVVSGKLVNSTEKGCHSEKSDFRGDMAHTFAVKAGRKHSETPPPRAASPLVGPKHCSPQHTWWWVCPYALSALLCWWKNRDSLPTAFHLLGQQLMPTINY